MASQELGNSQVGVEPPAAAGMGSGRVAAAAVTDPLLLPPPAQGRLPKRLPLPQAEPCRYDSFDATIPRSVPPQEVPMPAVAAGARGRAQTKRTKLVEQTVQLDETPTGCVTMAAVAHLGSQTMQRGAQRAGALQMLPCPVMPGATTG